MESTELPIVCTITTPGAARFNIRHVPTGREYTGAAIGHPTTGFPLPPADAWAVLCGRQHDVILRVIVSDAAIPTTVEFPLHEVSARPFGLTAPFPPAGPLLVGPLRDVSARRPQRAFIASTTAMEHAAAAVDGLLHIARSVSMRELVERVYGTDADPYYLEDKAERARGDILGWLCTLDSTRQRAFARVLAESMPADPEAEALTAAKSAAADAAMEAVASTDPTVYQGCVRVDADEWADLTRAVSTWRDASETFLRSVGKR